MSPLVPLIVLLLGVGLLVLGFFVPRLQAPGLAALAATSVALVAMLIIAFRLPAEATFSDWGPASLLASDLMLEVDPLAWLFGVSVLVITLAALLTGLARSGGRRIVARAAMLMLAFAGLAALLSDNLITRVLAWATLDLIYFFVLLFLARGEGIEPQAVLNLSFNSAGTLLAVAAALMISRTSDTLSLRDAALTPQSTLLITLAAVFRLGLFPLHLGLPTETNIRQGVGTLLRLIPAVVALELVARLSAFGFAESTRPWLTLFGVAAAVVGAAQLWTSDEPRQGVTYAVIAQSGLALLAGLWGGPLSVAAVTARALALILGGALIFLSNGHDEQYPWVTAFSLIGAAAMLGAPLTAGIVAAQGIYGGLAGQAAWPALIASVVAQTLLAAGLLRTCLWPGQPLAATLEPGPLVDAGLLTGPRLLGVYVAGLALPTAYLVLAGLAAGQWAAALGISGLGLLGIGNPSGWLSLALVVISMGLGVVLWRFEEFVRAPADTTGGRLLSLIRLDWLYRWAWGLFRLVGGAVFTVAAVVEGEGAMLWVLVAVLLVWLVFQGPGP